METIVIQDQQDSTVEDMLRFMQRAEPKQLSFLITLLAANAEQEESPQLKGFLILLLRYAQSIYKKKLEGEVLADAKS